MQRTLPLAFLSLILIVILAACGQSTPEATPTPIPTDTAIPTPVFTATPSTPLAILVMPPDLDPTMYDLYQTTVYDLAQQAGFRFQVRNSLSELDLEPGLRVVIALPPDPGPGIAALAAAAPQTQFLAINIPDLDCRRKHQRTGKQCPGRYCCLHGRLYRRNDHRRLSNWHDLPGWERRGAQGPGSIYKR